MSVFLITPHAGGDFARGRSFYQDGLDAELADRFEDWHEGGAAGVAVALSDVLGRPTTQVGLPRDVVDLNRPLLSEPPAVETLFGKSAIDGWTRARLRPGAEAELRAYYAASMAEIRAASRSARLFVEVHEYGEKGSTYDQQGAERRPFRRPACALIPGTPWSTSDLSSLRGIERLLPANLAGLPWPLELAVGARLRPPFIPGTSPYPTRTPWALSSRFLAAGFFAWAGQAGVIPVAAAAALADRAWGDPFDGAPVDGTEELAARVAEWKGDGGAGLVDRFNVEARLATMVIEIRNDLRADAAALGRQVGEGIAGWIAAG